jgi:uridylate kinase
MKNIVLSIGGSVVLSEELNVSFFKELANLLKKIGEKNKLFIIVGGGLVARRYIKLGRELGFNEEQLDLVGIDVTRINARFLKNTLGDLNVEVPISIHDAIMREDSIVVMGGTTPGHSTDMVGAEIAEKIQSDLFIIATNVDGIFNKDPNKYDDARLIREIEIDNLIDSFGTEWKSAGKNIVVDGPALKVIKRAKLNTCVINGKKLNQLENVLSFRNFEGTKIIV